MHDGEYLTCECEISTDDKSVITMEYIQSEMSGKIFACDDEFLLVEKRDPRNKRKFKVESEICGSTRRESRSLDDSLVRLTYMAGKPNTTDSKRGFLAKFKGKYRLKFVPVVGLLFLGYVNQSINKCLSSKKEDRTTILQLPYNSYHYALCLIQDI